MRCRQEGRLLILSQHIGGSIPLTATNAPVVELEDTLGLGSNVERRAGSNPVEGTKIKTSFYASFYFSLKF